jgi:hypothetical protein
VSPRRTTTSLSTPAAGLRVLSDEPPPLLTSGRARPDRSPNDAAGRRGAGSQPGAGRVGPAASTDAAVRPVDAAVLIACDVLRTVSGPRTWVVGGGQGRGRYGHGDAACEHESQRGSKRAGTRGYRHPAGSGARCAEKRSQQRAGYGCRTQGQSGRHKRAEAGGKQRERPDRLCGGPGRSDLEVGCLFYYFLFLEFFSYFLRYFCFLYFFFLIFF